jgi:TonB-dependent SusC/RagA subfamily outer membrane receptor
MKTLSLFCLLVLSCCICFAQKPLTNSRVSSYYTYIYAISDNDLAIVYESKQHAFDERMLHHPIDSILTDKYRDPKLPPGNYIKVYAEQNKLNYSLIENHTAFLQVLDNQKDLRFVLLDNKGDEIKNTPVYLENKSVEYDAALQLYHHSYNKKDRWIKVSYQGVVNYFTLTQRTKYKPKFWTWFRYYTPVKYAWRPIENLLRNHHYYQQPTGRYDGFVAFNKPKYKPGDTIRYKAYVFGKKSKKVITQKTLYLRLRQRNDDGKIIGTVTSYCNGFYEGAIPITDSLKLELDEDYTLSFEKTPKLDEDNDRNPEESKNVYITGKFTYEEYELKSIKFAMRSDKDVQSPGKPATLYLKATDENDLPVADGRVTLTVTTSAVTDYYNKKVFVPDTLWLHNLQLDPIGETKLVIPDSIFPKADLRFYVNAVFLNSNNEKQTQYTSLTFNNSRYHITNTLNQDTLKIAYDVLGKPAATYASVIGLSSANDTLSRQRIALPAQLTVDPVVARYTIKTDSVTSDVDVKNFKSDISPSALRTADSVFINVNNPRRIPFWYTIFSGNKIIEAGKTTGNWQYKRAYHANGNVFLLLNYIWSGIPGSDEVTIAYRDKLLRIVAKQPVSVYPGQQVPIEIDVNNAQGKPVPDVDLTAYAYTSKFTEDNTPSVPYFGKRYPARKLKTKLQVTDMAESGAFELNWKRWGAEMGLDSIAYFQFTHPKDIYTIQEPAPDSLTQIAPFVVKNGAILPVHVLFIDERPVYFSKAEQLQRYSFKVSPGSHSITFGIVDQSITVDRVFVVAKGSKMILSVNADTANHKIRIVNMPQVLTPYEANLINKYMIRVKDNFDYKMATIEQDDKTILLNPAPSGMYQRYGQGILTGPLSADYALLNVKKGISLGFLAEPNYSYEFMPGLLKQKSVDGIYSFNEILDGSPVPGYQQYALTPAGVDSLWQQFLDERSYSIPIFKNEYIAAQGNGRLTVFLDGYYGNNYPLKKNPGIKSVIVYRDGNPDFLRIYPGNTTMFGNLEPGKYRLLYLFRGDSYHIVDDISVKAGGVNFYRASIYPVKAKDSVSIKIAEAITARSIISVNNNNIEDKQTLNIKEAFNTQYLDNSSFADEMTGTVVSADDKLGIPGVSIKVKGTAYGTITDMNGHFRLHVPPHGKLTIAFIGYESQELTINPGANIKVVLTASAKMLSEVVVVGYGTVSKRDMMGSISAVTSYNLEGKVAGIMIRGASSVPASKPLYVVDGVIVDGDGVNAADIADVTTLKDAAATAIYGARASNGVVIITTKKGKANGVNNIELPGGANTLRTNFRDYAYWQPKLTTDARGKASFNVTFPDDITSWRTIIAGIGGKYTGYADGVIKAYKALSANMVAPQFAIKGDEMNVLGKVMNYTTDAVSVNRNFLYNGNPVRQGVLSVKNAVIDTFRITAADKDSLRFEYTVKKDNGYFDGERRSIPVFEQGVLETKGTFADLEKDTTVTLKFDPALGKVTFRAESSVLPALIEETGRLRNYEYLCNEQLASKLKGLLVEKRIRTYLAQPFKWDKNVLDLIKKLQENRRAEGTWGWWKDTEEELWISLHAVEALVEADKEGYKTNIDKQKLIDYLMYRVTSYQGANKLDAINLLLNLSAKADYAQLLTAYEKSLSPKVKQLDYDKLKLMATKQRAGLPVAVDSLLLKKRYTMFGNVYWGENDSYRFFDNSIQVSLLAYHILKAEGKHPEMLIRIRNYFLEQRKEGYWRNTYESSLILETILPDLFVGKQTPAPPAITLSGDKSETVSQFPYTTTLSGNAVLKVAKTGVLPVYITGYQQFWNKQPLKVSKDFTVDTWFEKGNNKVTRLKGGEPVSLQAEVVARADADFVMVEIPIPAGCSYESKEQPYWGYEVHREYFKNKVSIFCRKLKQGKYTFTIKLMPRYGGNYTLNPAKAEMMYFPVFYGREDLKRVTIN